MTVPPVHEQKLSGLALMDAYLHNDYDEYRNVIDNTPAYELHGGLVSLMVDLLGEYGAFLGMHPFDVIKALRSDLLAEL